MWFQLGDRILAQKTLDEDGRASVKLPRFGKRGLKDVTIRYFGDDLLEPATSTYTLRVVR